MTSRHTNWVNWVTTFIDRPELSWVESSWVELCRYKHPLKRLLRWAVEAAWLWLWQWVALGWWTAAAIIMIAERLLDPSGSRMTFPPGLQAIFGLAWPWPLTFCSRVVVTQWLFTAICACQVCLKFMGYIAYRHSRLGGGIMFFIRLFVCPFRLYVRLLHTYEHDIL